MDDWTTVQAFWQDTYEPRRSLLVVDKIATTEYIDKFLCLKVDEGKVLVRNNLLCPQELNAKSNVDSCLQIAQDFRRLHPDCEIVGDTGWKIIKTCLSEGLRV